MSVRITSNVSILSNPALDRETARKSRTPIMGDGPLVARYNSPKHGLVIRKIEVKR